MRFSVLPVIGLALLSFAAPASAQVPSSTKDPDLVAQYRQLTRDYGQVHRDYVRIQHGVDRCHGFDPAEVIAVQAAANELSQRAATLALELPGRQHAATLTIQDKAETDFWYLSRLAAPDICYQPAA